MKSPGGIEAWLVRDPAVPLIAVDFAFAAAPIRIPRTRPALASLAASLLDEGAGSLDAKTFQEKLERRAIELGFRATRDNFRGTLRTLKENRDEAFDALAARAERAALRRRGGRAHARADAVAVAAQQHEPERHRQPDLVGGRVPQSSLRPADRRARSNR